MNNLSFACAAPVKVEFTTFYASLVRAAETGSLQGAWRFCISHGPGQVPLKPRSTDEMPLRHQQSPLHRCPASTDFIRRRKNQTLLQPLFTEVILQFSCCPRLCHAIQLKIQREFDANKTFHRGFFDIDLRQPFGFEDELFLADVMHIKDQGADAGGSLLDTDELCS